MISAQQLLAIFTQARDADVWATAISAAWQRFAFPDGNACAGYLGIVGNETGGLREVRRENMNYSPERAAEVWAKARDVMSGGPNGTCYDRCAKGPEAFANWIYARIVGNGDEASGDGWRYRGGGIIQLTGRANYRACGEALGIDLEHAPELLTDDPSTSALAAAWFMAKRVQILSLLDSDDEADFLAGARKVGLPPGGATETRLRYRRKALEVLGATAGSTAVA